MNTILYSVLNHRGAHLMLATRETEAGTVADMQLIGALESFTVPILDAVIFAQVEAMSSGDQITLLAQEAVTVYGLEPGRVQRAAELARDPYAVQNARRNEHGEQIKPSLKVQCVKGSKGWYTVRPGSCTCPDHAKGNTCKHRIAAWMRRESITRPLAEARKMTPAEVLAELIA